MNDINDIVIDTALPVCERIQKYLESVKNPYRIQCGETVVNLRFSDDGNTLDAHLLNFFSGLKKG